MAADVICELNSVSKAFRRRAVIDDLDLRVERGEILGIIGRSGSGKSTILNMIGLLEPPDGGSISLFGKPAPGVKTYGAQQLLRNRVGYLFQNAALIDSESVECNLRIAQTYSPASRAAQREAQTEALRKVGLEGTEDRRVYELSGGEQQRVAVARLLLKPCDLILADEPTGSLDPSNRDDVLTLLEQLNTEGKTILIVTHDPAVAARCHRVVTPDGAPAAR